MQNESFGKVEKDASERLDHLEQTLPHLARLNEQLYLSDSVSKLSKDLEKLAFSEIEIKNKLDELKDSVDSVGKNHVFDQAYLANLIAEVRSKAELNSAQLNQINSSLKSDISSLNDHKDGLYLKIQEVIDLIDSHPKVAKANLAVSAVSLDLENTKADVALLDKKSDSLSASLTAYASSMSAIYKDRDADKTEIASLRLLVDHLRSDLDKFKKDSRFLILDSLEQHKEEVSKKFASLPVPEKVPLDEVKDEFDRKLQPVSFDAKNANLRSSNNETKILLLEKKVEQLFLFKSQSDLNK